MKISAWDYLHTISSVVNESRMPLNKTVQISLNEPNFSLFLINLEAVSLALPLPNKEQFIEEKTDISFRFKFQGIKYFIKKIPDNPLHGNNNQIEIKLI